MGGSSNGSPLFRAEVVEARSAQYLGSIRIARNPGYTSVAVVAVVLTCLLVAFATWGQVTRKARIAGVLVPRLGSLHVRSPVAGVVVERSVTEGRNVATGDVLFVLGIDRIGSRGDTAALVAENLTQRRAGLRSERSVRELQARQRQQALADRIRALDVERRQGDEEALLIERRVSLATRSAERYAQLAREGFVADVQSQAKQDEAIDLQARAQSARRNAAALAREQQSLRFELAAAATQLQADLHQIDRALAVLEQDSLENEARRSLAVRAPQSGLVTALNLPLGATVHAGQTLATLVPDGEGPETHGLEAHLYAPSRSAGFVETKQIVWLRYAAFPYQKFGMARGVVTAVSRTPIDPQDLPAGLLQPSPQVAQRQEPLYRVIVRIDRQSVDAYGQAYELKPGMTLEAHVLQEQRSVWEWILDPLIAVRHQIGVPHSP